MIYKNKLEHSLEIQNIRQISKKYTIVKGQKKEILTRQNRKSSSIQKILFFSTPQTKCIDLEFGILSTKQLLQLAK